MVPISLLGLIVGLLHSLMGQGCVTEHIVQKGEECKELMSIYSLDQDRFQLWNEGIDCAQLEPGTTICVKEREFAESSTTSSTTKHPHQKNLMETLMGELFGAEHKVAESPGPLIYHTFPDYSQD